MLSPTLSKLARIGAFASLMVFVADASLASGGGRGGGVRGGGGMSMSRGGGGGGFSRGGSFSRPSGGVSRPSSGQRPGAGQLPSRGGAVTGQRPGGGVGERPGIGSGQRPGGGDRTNIRGGDRNTNINRGDINIDNDAGGWGGWYDHPIAAGVAVGAVAGVTAAAIGSAYYALPPGCPPYSWSGYSYYACGGAYYEPRYEGDTVVYVTVPDPSSGQAPPPKQ